MNRVVAGLLVLGLTGCATQPAAVTTLPANLAIDCAPLPMFDDGQQVTMVQWIITASDMYRSCAERHRLTVKSIKTP